MSKPATTPRLAWQWDFGSALGEAEARRLLDLLRALLDMPALGEAARAAGMSYRAAWGLLKRCEEELGLPLVAMQRGRGTRLTELGESLVELDGAARLALGDVHRSWEGRMRDLLEAQPGSRPLRLAASHDIALADWMEHGRRLPVTVTWRGSDETLAALGRGECDVAGFHAPEDWRAEQLVAWLGRWLEPHLHACLPVMRRRQGLLVARGNPLQLATLADAARRGARLVNRQPGSGTRRLIDQLLAANGIAARDIAGYAREEFTHDAVAATVASGQADVGLGIEAAAVRYDLDFIPLHAERYGFVLRYATARGEAGRAFLARLGGRTFRQRLQSLPGYEALAPRAPGTWSGFLHP